MTKLTYAYYLAFCVFKKENHEFITVDTDKIIASNETEAKNLLIESQPSFYLSNISVIYVGLAK